MFKVSTKGDYALLLMTAFAEKGKKKFVSLKEIAAEKKLSFSYLSQIILPLRRAKLVESKEGIGGGYRIAKKTSEITLMEILEAVEGKIAPVKCCDIKKAKCGCEAVCGVKSAWKDAALLLNMFLSSRTLEDTSGKKHQIRNTKSETNPKFE